MLLLGDAIAKAISEELDVPINVAQEMVMDIRMMNDNLDAAFDDDSENTEEIARTLYEKLTADARMVNWLKKRAEIARQTLDTLTS